MDDMNAFERQVAGEFVRRAGLVHPVDAAAIFTAITAITATQPPRWRFQSMFSAAKFVVAAAILALCGGFLLSGVLTQPSDEMAPAAVSASPSTSPDLLPGVDLVTEEVEPGVERIVSDGIRDLSGVGPSEAQSHGEKDGLAVAPDGAVWLYLERPDPTLVKLGDPGSFPAPSTQWPVLRVSPDGTLWSRTWDEGVSIRRFGAEGWLKMASIPGGQSHGWDLDADGAVWTGGEGAQVLRLGASGWEEYPIDLDSFDDEFRQLLEDYGEDPDAAGRRPYFEDIAVDTNGDVWAALSVTDSTDPMVLLRYDGETWSLVDPLGLGGYQSVGLLDVGTDGTLWVYLDTGKDPRFDPEKDDGGEPDRHYLARLADERWTVFSEEDGVVGLWPRGSAPGLLRVDHDGTAWMQPIGDEGLRGVRVFDGRTWRHYLDDHHVVDIEFAPDGRAWVLTSDQLYVITPEAEATTE